MSDMNPPASAITSRAFYDAHVGALFAYAERRVGVDVASDVVAETFRIALDQPERYDPRQGDARGWLFGIATNLLRRHWRTEVRRLRALTRLTSGVGNVLDPAERVIERVDAAASIGRVLEAVSKLSVEDRDLLVLIAWEGFTDRQVGEAIGIPAGTVRSRLHRIRRALRSATNQGDHHG